MAKAAKAFFVLVAVASLLNGSLFWLRRVGWVSPDLHEEYLARFGPESDYRGTPSEILEKQAFVSRLYQVPGPWLIVKLFKDILVAVFLAGSTLVAVRLRKAWLAMLRWPMFGLLLFVLVGFFVSFFGMGTKMAVAGVRSFSFLFVGLLGAWAATSESLDFFSKALAALLAFQLILVPAELVSGLPLFPATLPGNRIVGTMLQPSSLGIGAAVFAVFGYCFAEDRRVFRFMAGAALVPVFLSASGTAWMVALFGLVATMLPRIPASGRRAFAFGAAGLAALLFVGLPWVTGRPDILSSPAGRVEIFMENVVQGASPVELAFGRGLGAGTNAAANLFMDWRTRRPETHGEQVVFIADSTPTMLTAQIGLMGAAMFYGLLTLCAWKDRKARAFYLVVVAAGFATNITELFPVNVLLGLAMARTLPFLGTSSSFAFDRT